MRFGVRKSVAGRNHPAPSAFRLVYRAAKRCVQKLRFSVFSTDMPEKFAPGLTAPGPDGLSDADGGGDEFEILQPFAGDGKRPCPAYVV